MTRTIPLLLALVFAAGAVAGTPAAHAAGPYRTPDNKNLSDPLEGTYPVPYKLPVAAEITAQLERVRGFADRATPIPASTRTTPSCARPPRRRTWSTC